MGWEIRGADGRKIMLKLMGALFLIAGCAGFGWCACMEMDGRIGQLHTLVRAFAMLEREVGGSMATLPEGMERVGRKLEGSLGTCFQRIGSIVRAGQEDFSGATFEETWQKEILDYLKDTCLKKKDRQMLLSFPDYTGFLDGQMQLLNLKQFGREMECAEEKAVQEAENRKKAVLSLSVTCGFLAVVVLL